jgi:hypothetical protein
MLRSRSAGGAVYVTIIPFAFDESEVGQRACRAVLPATRETRVQRQDWTRSVETSIPPWETKGLSEERPAYLAHEAWICGLGSGGSVIKGRHKCDCTTAHDVFPLKRPRGSSPRVSSTASPHVRGILSNGPDSPYFPPSCRSAHGPAATTAIRYLPVPAAKGRQNSSGCRSSSSR